MIAAEILRRCLKMHKDHHETVQRLFALATMLAAAAQEIAIAGQSPKLLAKRRHALTLKLRRKTVGPKSIADAVLTVTHSALNI
jgi:hypothetical protein